MASSTRSRTASETRSSGGCGSAKWAAESISVRRLVLGCRRVDDLPARDAHEPGAEGAAFGMETVPAAPGAEEHLLGDVLGFGGVAERASGHGVDERAPVPLRRGEGVLVRGAQATGHGPDRPRSLVCAHPSPVRAHRRIACSCSWLCSSCRASRVRAEGLVRAPEACGVRAAAESVAQCREPKTLTTGELARRLGVAPTAIRSRDSRYGLGPSVHAGGRHRRWTAVDVARLERMCASTQ